MARTNHASGLTVTLCRTALVILASTIGALSCPAKPSVQARQAWAIPTPYVASPILQDVSRSGMLLLDELGGYVASHSWNSPNPKLVLQTFGPGTQVEVPLPGWPKYQYELPEGIAEVFPGPFRFVGAGEGIVGVQGPWLVLIDVPSRKEIRRVVALKDLTDFEQPKLPIPVLKSPAPGKLINTGKTQMVAQAPLPPLLAVSPLGDRLAVAYNGPAKHWIFVYTSDLTRRLASWRAPKRVQDLCWSRDGKLLAVLYHNAYTPYNRQGKFTGWHPDVALADIPNVSIFDTTSWKERLSFATGGYDAKAAFSPDEKLLYIIAAWHGGALWSWARDDIRAFSTSTGKLEQTIKVKGTGVRSNFAVSPDGRLIAAESTTDVGFPLVFDQPSEYLDVNAGFVILDAATGGLLFRAKRRTLGSGFGSLPIFFTADGQMLIVNFASSTDGDAGGHIVGYSLPEPSR